MSKGKYILPLDSDDMYLNSDFFHILNQEIDIMDVDIIKYRSIVSYNLYNPLGKRGTFLKPPLITENKVLYQPELGLFGDDTCVLWAHCIKSEFYKKAIDLYGKNRILNYINFLEDCIMHFILHQTAKTLKLFLKIGYIYIGRPKSDSRIQNKTSMIRAHFYDYESKFEFAKYTKFTRDITVKNIIKLIKQKEFQELIKDIKMKDYIIAFMKRIISNNNITNERKNELIQACIQNNLTNITNFN